MSKHFSISVQKRFTLKSDSKHSLTLQYMRLTGWQVLKLSALVLRSMSPTTSMRKNLMVTPRCITLHTPLQTAQLRLRSCEQPETIPNFTCSTRTLTVTSLSAVLQFTARPVKRLSVSSDIFNLISFIQTLRIHKGSEAIHSVFYQIRLSVRLPDDLQDYSATILMRTRRGASSRSQIDDSCKNTTCLRALLTTSVIQPWWIKRIPLLRRRKDLTKGSYTRPQRLL